MRTCLAVSYICGPLHRWRSRHNDTPKRRESITQWRSFILQKYGILNHMPVEIREPARTFGTAVECCEPRASWYTVDTFILIVCDWPWAISRFGKRLHNHEIHTVMLFSGGLAAQWSPSTAVEDLLTAIAWDSWSLKIWPSIQQSAVSGYPSFLGCYAVSTGE
jgi:hypothetical protein